MCGRFRPHADPPNKAEIPALNWGQLDDNWPRFSRKAEPLIASGSILIENGTPLPQFFRAETETYPNAWIAIGSTLNFHERENELTATGWTFLYMASKVRATAFGFDRQKMVHRALERLIAGARLQKCNCLEIDEVAMHSFLGMPYVSVSAHSRNIQKGLVFSGH
jgi:hypothetical protein